MGFGCPGVVLKSVPRFRDEVPVPSTTVPPFGGLPAEAGVDRAGGGHRRGGIDC
jgi:hypothetical protein